MRVAFDSVFLIKNLMENLIFVLFHSELEIFIHVLICPLER